MIESPLNYTGGKSKLLNQILPIFPTNINTFVDLFCGGCNVGLNVQSNNVCYNDNNIKVIELYKKIKKTGIDNVINYVYDIINKYNLSLVSKYGYDYYNCNSIDGVAKYNKNKYIKLRTDYNEQKKEKSLLLYVLIVYAFNNQIRFNNKGEFNLPVGKRDFNKKMEEKLYSFINRISEQNCKFTSKDFRKYDFSKLDINDFVYVDPPYLITCASYNEKGGWIEKDEKDLLSILDYLNEKKIKFAFSNVLKNKGKENKILSNWIKSRKSYNVHHLNYTYTNCNYHTNKNKEVCDEVLIVNY